MALRNRSIEQKIFLIILPICLVPAFVFLLLVVFGSRLTFEQTMGSELERQAKLFSGRLDQFLADHMQQIQARIQPGEPDLIENVRATARRGGWIGALALMRPGGEVQCFEVRSEDEVFYKRVLAERPLLREVMNSDSVTTSGTIVDFELPASGQDHPLAAGAFIYGLPDGGRLACLFAGARMGQAFRQSLHGMPEFLLIYSLDGFVVYTSEPLLDREVKSVRNRIQDNPSLEAWFPAPMAPRSYLMATSISNFMKRIRQDDPQSAVWVTVTRYDLEMFLGPLETLVWLSILLALGLVLLMLALASAASRWLATPLRGLRLQAEQLAQGNLEVRATVQGRDEIGQLADSFNQMGARLRRTYQTLEDRLEENRLRAEHINAMNELTQAIVQAPSLDGIFECLQRELVNLLPFDALWLALLEGLGGDLQVSRIQPMGLISLFSQGHIPRGWSLHGRVADSGETIHAEIGPQHRTEFFETRIFNAENFQSYLIAPLPARNRMIGTLTVASTAPDAYNSELAEIFTSLARTVAIALEQSHLFQQISQFATELEHKVAERTRELETATQKLIQTEKYFATGRMAGNLAHEINNPLGIIRNYLTLVRNNLTRAGGGRRATDPNLDHLQVINEEVERIARLVRQLLNLHRPVEQKVEAVDLNAMIEELLGVMGDDLQRSNIEVQRHLAPDLPRPMVEADLLRQVLINLLRNAQDAMEQGGLMTVRTSSITEWEEGEERQLVRIKISDTGCGIPPEHLSQIFDPFFTTKPPEKGTGLGLCVSYSIVRMYHGSIEVESEAGKGTSVLVTLPVQEKEDAAAPESE